MDATHPTQWVEEFEARLADLQQKSQSLEYDIAASTATATSRDGAVTVTVGPNGGLQNLVLGHRAVELGAAQLTSLILSTARTAQKEAAGKVLEAFKPLGEGTEAYQMVTHVITADEEPETAAGDEDPNERRAPVNTPAPQGRRRPADDEDEDETQPW